jgi:hypothetical protein
MLFLEYPIYSLQGGQFSMIVVVPTGNTTVDALLERLSKTSMEKIYHYMITEDEEYPDAFVEVYLPRVVINSDFVLNRALEKVKNRNVMLYTALLNTVFFFMLYEYKYNRFMLTK